MADALEIPAAARTWPASVFSLVTGAFLLPVGRLADMYGGKIIFVSGLVWFLIWCLVSGFSHNYQMLIVARALAGLGPAAFLPSSVMLLGKTYRPGPRKNLIFGLYGAFAPLGFFFGIIIAGVAAESMTWRWYFFLGTIVLAIVCATSFVTIPRDRGEDRDAGVKMDYLGVATIVDLRQATGASRHAAVALVPQDVAQQVEIVVKDAAARAARHREGDEGRRAV